MRGKRAKQLRRAASAGERQARRASDLSLAEKIGAAAKDRDKALSALYLEYHPRLKGLAQEHAEKREKIYIEFEQRRALIIEHHQAAA